MSNGKEGDPKKKLPTLSSFRESSIPLLSCNKAKKLVHSDRLSEIWSWECNDDHDVTFDEETREEVKSGRILIVCSVTDCDFLLLINNPSLSIIVIYNST
jgi:hypothetical protein